MPYLDGNSPFSLSIFHLKKADQLPRFLHLYKLGEEMFYLFEFLLPPECLQTYSGNVFYSHGKHMSKFMTLLHPNTWYSKAHPKIQESNKFDVDKRLDIHLNQVCPCIISG